MSKRNPKSRRRNGRDSDRDRDRELSGVAPIASLENAHKLFAFVLFQETEEAVETVVLKVRCCMQVSSPMPH